jgi:hypothetical protein
MRVGEQDAARRETIHVRRMRLWMAFHAADPVVEIIDDDKKDVGMRFPSRRMGERYR